MIECSFCRKKIPSEEASSLRETRDGNTICISCAQIFHYCEICGSVALDTNQENQLHFDELCFK